MSVNQVLAAIALSFICTAALAAMPPGDASRGATLFASNCAACHNAVEGGGDGQGPNLYGVYGRPAGAEKGFPYSTGFASAKFVWDAPHLDQWLTKPTSVIPTAYMMYAQPDGQIRADIIAYLKTQGGH